MPTINRVPRIHPITSPAPELSRSAAAQTLIDAINKLTKDEVLDLQAHATQALVDGDELGPDTVHLYVMRATAWLIAHGKVVVS